MEGIWLHRISHCAEVSYPLLKRGYLTIGFSDFLADDQFLQELFQPNIAADIRWAKFEEANIRVWGEKYRTRHNLWKFLAEFAVDDLVLVPSWGSFSVYRIVDRAKPISEVVFTSFMDSNNKEIVLKNGMLYRGDKRIDLGYIIKVEAIALDVSRAEYAGAALTSRMKMRQANASISDLREEVVRALTAIKENKPLNFYKQAIEAVEENLLKTLQTHLNDSKLEQLIQWYFKKLGANDAYIPAKNEHGKRDGADADIIAVFEALKMIVYVQAKYHTGTTSQWAVRQIAEYKKQKQIQEQEKEKKQGIFLNDEYSGLAWVISTCDAFSEEAILAANNEKVRLIDGREWVKMLIDVGIDGINNSFGK